MAQDTLLSGDYIKLTDQELLNMYKSLVLQGGMTYIIKDIEKVLLWRMAHDARGWQITKVVLEADTSEKR